jgi:hypothetical protein
MPRFRCLVFTSAIVLFLMPLLEASHATPGADVKITNDNNNVDGGTPNPSFDAQNRQANEPTMAISPADPNIVASAANDYGMVTVIGDAWLGVYVSSNGGATWFNTMVPGFPSDTSPAGSASPLLNLDGAGDPVVRFDAAGNLYVSGIAFNRDFDQADKPVDNVVFVARYDYTPGSPAGVSTPNSAANPPDFTYAGTTVVQRGAVGFAVPGQPFGFAGNFVDKEWMAVDDTNLLCPYRAVPRCRVMPAGHHNGPSTPGNGDGRGAPLPVRCPPGTTTVRQDTRRCCAPTVGLATAHCPLPTPHNCRLNRAFPTSLSGVLALKSSPSQRHKSTHASEIRPLPSLAPSAHGSCSIPPRRWTCFE